MKRALLIALTACLISTTAACGGKSEMTPEELAKLTEDKLAEAEAMIASDQEGLAKANFDWVLEQDPNNGRAHAGMAQMYLGKNDPQSATPHAEKAAAASPDDPKVQATLGEVLGKVGRAEEAAAAYAKAWELSPDDTRYGHGQGKALNAAKKYAEAEAVLRKVGDEDPRAQYVWTDLGDALREQDKLDEALRTYMKAQNEYGSDKGAYAGAAMVYEAKEEWDKAVTQLGGYIQRDCCSTYSDEWAKPKLLELEAKAKGGAAPTEDAPEDAPEE